MQIEPYLIFTGNCAEAFRFYERCLGGRIAFMQTFGESPARDHVPGHWRDKIVHVRLEVDGKAIMGSDGMPDDTIVPQGVNVSVSVDSPAEAERIFTALAEGGKVTMPFAKTFWSPGFGMLTDRFGIPWMVNTAVQPA